MSKIWSVSALWVKVQLQGLSVLVSDIFNSETEKHLYVVLLEKLLVAQLGNKLSDIYGIWIFTMWSQNESNRQKKSSHKLKNKRRYFLQLFSEIFTFRSIEIGRTVWNETEAHEVNILNQKIIIYI